MKCIIFQVDKSQFKTGAFDQLMALNETTGKIDGQLDTLCKKFEKVAFDNGTQKLTYAMPNNRDTSKFPFSDLLVSYDDYIKTFEWNNNKYSYKRSLPELTGIITKKMKDHDDLLKKHQEEQSSIKSQLSGFMKKEGGNLAIRDYTDDIYSQNNVTKDWFVEGMGSEMFTNLLVVVHKLKEATFPAETTQMMKEYYDAQDATEDKRVPDQVKQKLAELKEKQEELDKFVAAAGLIDCVGKDDFEEKAKEYIEKGIKAELAKKRKHRLTEIIAPDAFKPLGLEDKEGNKVFRMVVLKSQAEDAIKACRRKGVSARAFSFDREQWLADNSQR